MLSGITSTLGGLLRRELGCQGVPGRKRFNCCGSHLILMALSGVLTIVSAFLAQKIVHFQLSRDLAAVVVRLMLVRGKGPEKIDGKSSPLSSGPGCRRWCSISSFVIDFLACSSPCDQFNRLLRVINLWYSPEES